MPGQVGAARGRAGARQHDRGGRVHGAAAAAVRDSRLRGLRRDRDGCGARDHDRGAPVGRAGKAVCKMLPSLANKKRLTALSARVSAARDAKTALDALLTVDTVGPFFAWQIFCDLASVAAVEPDALPARVIKDSQTNYAIFGPGARKGAYLMDGGEAAYDVLNDDQDINQEEALARARAIVKDFPAALRADRVGGGVEGRRERPRVRPRGGRAQPLRLVRRGPRPHPRGGRRGRHSRAGEGQFPLREQQRARGRLAPQPVHGPRAEGRLAIPKKGPRGPDRSKIWYAPPQPSTGEPPLRAYHPSSPRRRVRRGPRAIGRCSRRGRLASIKSV